MNLRVVKARRILRKLPKAWLYEMVETFLNRGTAAAFLVAVIGLYLILQGATPEERDVQAFNWAISVQAFGWALVIWAAISLIRAPIVIIRADRLLGAWQGNRFVFHQPHLIFSRHCKPTGRVETFKFKVTEVEPAAFMYYSIELDGAPKLAEIGFGGVMMFLGLLPYRNWPGTGGLKLPRDNIAMFQIRLPEEAVSTTVRIYCRSFVVGKLDDKDGATGNHQFPLRQTPKGNAERRSA